MRRRARMRCSSQAIAHTGPRAGPATGGRCAHAPTARRHLSSPAPTAPTTRRCARPGTAATRARPTARTAARGRHLSGRSARSRRTGRRSPTARARPRCARSGAPQRADAHHEDEALKQAELADTAERLPVCGDPEDQAQTPQRSRQHGHAARQPVAEVVRRILQPREMLEAPHGASVELVLGGKFVQRKTHVHQNPLGVHNVVPS